MANFVFVLSKQDVNAATRCFQFAKIAHSKNHTVNLFSDFSRLISAPLYEGNAGTSFRTHTGFLSLCAGLDFPTMKLDSVLHLCVV